LGASAPLTTTAEAPVPPNAEAEWFEGVGGARLRAALFRPEGVARGAVVLSPGRTEPIEKYFEVSSELTGRGLAVLVHDWRGQGLSHRMLPDRLYGHAAGYADFLGDYRALLDGFAERLPQPWLAMGHSMGGCLTLLALAKGERRFQGAILSAPMLGLELGLAPLSSALAIVALQRLIGRAGAMALPAYDALADRFETERLTHDRARYQRHKAQLRACPELALSAPTWGWLDFAFTAMAAIAAPGALEHIEIPVTIVGAGEDKIVRTAASRAAAARLPKGRYVEIEDAWHELLQETDDRRARFWAEFDALLSRL
jgi:lysophospholipase